MRRLTIEIECGQTTCTAGSGKLCLGFGRGVDTTWCAIFRTPDGLGTRLRGPKRCQACLDAEKADPAGKIIEAMVGEGACPDFLGIITCSESGAERCPAEEMRFGAPKAAAAIRACWDKWLKGELK